MTDWLKSRQAIACLGVVLFACGLWVVPPPEGVTEDAWHLFAIFIATILAVLINATSILIASIFALVAAVLSGTLQADVAYAGFGSDFILLILVAFLIGRGVIRSGLSLRIAYTLVRMFGRSSLGLGYSLVAADALIAPAFPSNTARSGVLYPIAHGLALGSGSEPDEATRRRLGAYLMMCGMGGLSLSSALWLTAMAANPTGAAIAASYDVDINFLNWLIASCVPCLLCMFLMPLMLYRFFPPELKATPEAPGEAAEELRKLGPFSRDEKITAVTAVLMVLGWALSDVVGFDKTAVAFLGLGILMLSGIFTTEDLHNSGDALGTFIWFAILYTLSSSLNELGFMAWLGYQLGGYIEGFPWPLVYVVLIVVYVLLHYLFVSQTAQMLALFGVFMGVAVDAGVPAYLIAIMLLFATNFFSAITPQGSSANVLFAGSGYLTQAEMYKYGGLITLLNLVVFMVVGTPWAMLVMG